MIFTMVVIGGITRLTGSGLSIVEWNVIMGTIPPLNEQQWQETFEKYQQFPEYQEHYKNRMDLAAFKQIFWWEYFHRLWGRLMGIVFLIPFIVFLLQKKLTPRQIKQYLLIFLLGGAQGFLGWFMVKSGLVDIPRVSHYRLTAHLYLAFLLYSITFWFALDRLLPQTVHTPHPERDTPSLRYFSWGIVLLTVIQIGFGGFTAGLKAGYLFGTFPKMGGEWVASGIWMMSPAWLNVLENPIMVQFIHRWLGIIVFATILALWIVTFSRKLRSIQKMGIHILLGVSILQVLMGIFTIVWRMPVALAVAHQAGALLLLTASLFVSYQFKR